MMVDSVSKNDLQDALNASAGQSIRPVAIGLGILMVLLSLAHVPYFSSRESLTMFSVEAFCGAGLFLIARGVNRHALPPRWVHPLGTVISVIGLFAAAMHLYASGNPVLGIDLILVMLGTALFFLSLPWLLTVMALSVGAWFLTWHVLLKFPVTVHLAIPLAAGSVLAIITHTIRLRSARKFHILKLDLEAREQAMKDLMRQLETKRQELMEFLDEAHDLVQTIGPDKHVQQVNRAWLQAMGYSADEASRLTLLDLLDPCEHARVMEMRSRILAGEDVGPFEVIYRDKSGNRITLEGRVHAKNLDGVGQVTRGIFRDITVRKLREQDNVWRATHDQLTELPNRRLFLDRLERMIAQAQRREAKFCVLFIDLDGFKEINDHYGHEAGDSVMITVAQRLSNATRRSDTVARHGGDEFTVLATELRQLADAARVAAVAMEAIEKPILFGNEEVKVGASIGIALGCSGTESATEMLGRADAAMYEAKRAGGRRWVVAATPTDSPAAPYLSRDQSKPS